MIRNCSLLNNFDAVLSSSTWDSPSTTNHEEMMFGCALVCRPTCIHFLSKKWDNITKSPTSNSQMHLNPNKTEADNVQRYTASQRTLLLRHAMEVTAVAVNCVSRSPLIAGAVLLDCFPLLHRFSFLSPLCSVPFYTESAIVDFVCPSLQCRDPVR